MCFLSRAYPSNAHKNKCQLPWGKQVSPTGSLRNLSQASRFTQWLHTRYSSNTALLHRVKETCPAKTQVTINASGQNGDTVLPTTSQEHTGVSDPVTCQPAWVRMPAPRWLPQLGAAARGAATWAPAVSPWIQAPRAVMVISMEKGSKKPRINPSTLPTAIRSLQSLLCFRLNNPSSHSLSL